MESSTLPPKVVDRPFLVSTAIVCPSLVERVNRADIRNRSDMKSSSDSGQDSKKPRTNNTEPAKASSPIAEAPAGMVNRKVAQLNAAGFPVVPYKFRPILADEVSPDGSQVQPAKKRRITLCGAAMDGQDAMWYSGDESELSMDEQNPASTPDITTTMAVDNTSSINPANSRFTGCLVGFASTDVLQHVSPEPVAMSTSSSSSGATPDVTANLAVSLPPTRQLRLMNSEEAVDMLFQDL